MAHSYSSEDDDRLRAPQNIDSHNPEIPEKNNSRPQFTEQQPAQPYICLMTRREFVITAGIATTGWAVGVRFSSVQPVEAAMLVEAAPAVATENMTAVDLTINGVKHQLSLDPRVTLLDLLRENLALTGTKKGCDHGQCGACTVLANGRRINSCLSLAVVHQGEEITTIEGIAQGDQLHPLQNAFLEHDGFQCGYCTPGQIMSAVACINEGHTGSDDEIREFMSGNLCRCGAYPNIIDAIKVAAKKLKE